MHRLMKWTRIGFVLLSIFFMSNCDRETEKSAQDQVSTDARVQHALTEARAVSNELASTLKSSLMRALGEGSFAGAIHVCSEIGQEIPAQISDSTGYYLRRVSLGYRNPADVPDDYERSMLEKFDHLNERQELDGEYYEVVQENSRRYLRYMKPLIASGMCLSCHGPQEQIPSEVQDVLSQQYPEDRATGYHKGDVRGAVSIKIELSDSGA